MSRVALLVSTELQNLFTWDKICKYIAISSA